MPDKDLTFYIEPMRVEQIPAVAAIERVCFTQPWPANAYKRELQGNRMAYYEVVRVAAPATEPERPAASQRAGQRPRQRAGDRASKSESSHRPIPSSHTTPSPQPTVALPEQSSLLGRLTRLLRPAIEPLSPELEAELRSIVGYAGLWLMADEAHVTTIAVHPDYRGRGLGELLLLGLIDHARTTPAKWVTLEVRVSNHVAQSLYKKYTFKEMGVRRAYYSDDREDALVMWTDPLDADTFQQTLERNRAQLLQRVGGPTPHER